MPVAGSGGTGLAPPVTPIDALGQILGSAASPITTTAGASAASTVRTAETSTLLAGNATRNGATQATAGYSKFRAFAAADVAGTLNIQQSRDGVTWYTTTSAAVAAGITAGSVLESIIVMPNIRAQYVNGAGAQGAFEFDSALVAV